MSNSTGTKATRLLSAAKISLLITKAVKTTQIGLELIHTAAVQCMLHAEKHGDVTLAARLMQEVKDNCKGVVVAGLAKWFKDNSPVKLIVENGQVIGSLLKEGEPGYKPFNTSEAEAAPAMEATDVTARANRPIEPYSLATFKRNLASQLTQLKKATGEGGRGVTGDVKQIETVIAATIEFANKIVSFPEGAGEKTEETPAKKAA